MNGNSPLAQNMSKFSLIQWDTLYDSVALVNGAFTGLRQFFQVPQGQIIPNGSLSKTQSDTNLTSTGQVNAGNAFEIHYIEFKILGPNANNRLTGIEPTIIELLQSRANVVLQISNIPRFTVPLQKIPFSFGINTLVQNQAVAAAATWASSTQWNAAPNGWRLEVRQDIKPLEAFQVQVQFDDSTTLANLGTTGQNRMICVLTGRLQKPAA